MPNPFSNGSVDKIPEGAIEIINSSLFCQRCFEETDKGIYYPDRKVVIFTCPNNHRNEVNNITL